MKAPQTKNLHYLPSVQYAHKHSLKIGILLGKGNVFWRKKLGLTKYVTLGIQLKLQALSLTLNDTCFP